MGAKAAMDSTTPRSEAFNQFQHGTPTLAYPVTSGRAGDVAVVSACESGYWSLLDLAVTERTQD